MQQKMHLLSNFVHLLICSLCPAAISYHCSTIKPESGSNFQQAQHQWWYVTQGAISHNTMQYHVMPYNTIQYHRALPYKTMIYHLVREASLTYGRRNFLLLDHLYFQYLWNWWTFDLIVGKRQTDIVQIFQQRVFPLDARTSAHSLFLIFACIIFS